MSNEIEQSLNAYLATVSYHKGPPNEAIKIAISDAYLTGFGDGLARAGEIATRSMDTALELMREHYSEQTGNALRDYLASPERQAVQGDPRGERDR